MAAYIRERRGVKRFWDEVYEYIEKAYDTDALKIININGDGASWIKSGAKYIKQAKFVLDKYHMHKYIEQFTKKNIWQKKCLTRYLR
ncbi:MAG: UPF0236 family protein [Lachnospiraceae bacterium]|nr:UPF0236 family protein [Lachnospiraceae bacterium]